MEGAVPAFLLHSQFVHDQGNAAGNQVAGGFVEFEFKKLYWKRAVIWPEHNSIRKKIDVAQQQFWAIS
jgi:hypothetical protein